eukprot:974479-Alexandrium_andersonii.AAC.1
MDFFKGRSSLSQARPAAAASARAGAGSDGSDDDEPVRVKEELDLGAGGPPSDNTPTKPRGNIVTQVNTFCRKVAAKMQKFRPDAAAVADLLRESLSKANDAPPPADRSDKRARALYTVSAEKHLNLMRCWQQPLDQLASPSTPAGSVARTPVGSPGTPPPIFSPSPAQARAVAALAAERGGVPAEGSPTLSVASGLVEPDPPAPPAPPPALAGEEAPAKTEGRDGVGESEAAHSLGHVAEAVEVGAGGGA